MSSKLHPYRFLIASTHRDEAITRVLMKHHASLPYHCEFIFLDELLNEFNIFDTVTDEKTTITWQSKEGMCYSNKDYALINRVTYIPNDIFDAFAINDRSYAKREFEAYLGFAFNAFATTDTHTPQGIVNNYYSLPKQWQLVADIPNLTTPRYFFGDAHVAPWLNTHRLVESHIYNLYFWKITPNAQVDQRIRFCFEKPYGIPLIILLIGKKYLISKADKNLNGKTISQIETIITEIRKRIPLFIGEILLFIDDKTITFGCINPNVITTPSHTEFETFVFDHLLDEALTC